MRKFRGTSALKKATRPQDSAARSRQSQQTFSQVDYLYAEVILFHTLYQAPGGDQVFWMRIRLMQLVPSDHWYTSRHAQGHHRLFLGFSVEIGDLERDVAFVQI